MKKCACGQDLPVKPGRGRLPAHCSNACRQRAYRNRKRLPVELTARKAWTRRIGKRPVSTWGRAASSTKQVTWSSYESVKASGVGDGYGVMLGDGLGCYDLDHCLTPGGHLERWAAEVAADIPERVLWVEKSMSGDGLHIFVEAPEQVGHKQDGVEFYSVGRFIAVTEDHFAL